MTVKKIVSIVSITLLTLPAVSQSKHVILISIDGLRPTMYQDQGWPTPNLQQLKKEGTYADHLLSVFPAYTYPSHTAMLTGATPLHSGVAYNQPIGSKGEWNWFAEKIRVPTLWQALKKKGLKTAAVEWPVSVTKDITWNIPEIWNNDHPSDRITETRKYATPGLVEELESKATGKLDSANMNEESELLDQNSAKMAAYIFNKYHPALLAVHFALVDGKQHDDGINAESVKKAVANADKCVGIILEAIQDRKDVTLLIVGDHGFSDMHSAMRPNILIQDIPAKFVSAGGSCFLYGQAGSEKAVIERLNKLPKGERDWFRIIEKPELNKMGADSAALLALAAQPGLVFSSQVIVAPKSNQGPGTSIQQDPHPGLFFPVKGGHHGYDPNIPEMYTGFIAWGSGIRKGGKIEELCVTDIAPLIAKLLNIEFKTPDGKLVQGILTNQNSKMKNVKILLVIILICAVSSLKAQVKPAGTISGIDPAIVEALKTDNASSLDKLVTKENVSDCYGNYSLLSQVIRFNAPKCFNLLIDKGADVNKRCNDYVPPMVHAVVYGRLDMIKKMVSKGADFHFKYTSEAEGLKDMTLVGYAEKYGWREVAAYLKSLEK